MKNAAGSSSTSVLIVLGSTPGRFQKAAVSVSQISCTTSISRPARPSKTTRRLGELAGQRVLEDTDGRVVLFRAALRQPGVAEVVLGLGVLAVPGLEQVDHVLA